MGDYCIDWLLEVFHILLYLLIDLVEEGREGTNEGWLKVLDVLDQILNLLTAITNPETKDDGISVDNLLIDMTERNVGEVNIFIGEVITKELSTDLARDEVLVAQHCHLWITSSSRRNA